MTSTSTPIALRPARLFAVVAICLALPQVACGNDDEESASTTTTAAGSIEVVDAWARTSAAAQDIGAAYFTVDNGGAADALVAASVPAAVAGSAQVHETTTEGTSTTAMGDANGATTTAMEGATTMPDGGMMGMREVDRVEIPAGGTVVFEPGGYHVMLMDLVGPLEAGDTFDMTLTFEKAGEMKVTVEVRDE